MEVPCLKWKHSNVGRDKEAETKGPSGRDSYQVRKAPYSWPPYTCTLLFGGLEGNLFPRTQRHLSIYHD
jgi:hypothetical protein